MTIPAPWIVDRIREAEQNRHNRESWERQPRVEVGIPLRPPPEEPATPTEIEGCIVVDFTI